ncbi:NUDIX hydrolase [Alkalihalobacillus alcalophilus ATCC 27647 = CGMCC 1.3604]|uniref:NUDIX hydrolase n=1 Tax=Alkalihalobacillus alcalophilus ATCC 27647 = CGMCC 1.3604 TaxID=1218173 RepID=A0A094YUL1_ALKAL|nr:NUDIX domain-containing protein [Alkalihalobacillus alcalophilus]KGA97187.1 NUDIX hydrolase [Alkalihalobacillus alcalophilus ATCC 27647 = CGMCC 1.3604]MED1560880.1 NUDIX domain-containing protein [Alkalihalobacillus alcalophilus]THG91828.1 NUDIX hydrolase [Alkalihalobacillus alcalophilus ATCC 27647 = CGMCC 1.3604]
MAVRNSIKALIIQNNHILLTKNEDREGFFYMCPGGGQEHGETFHQALQRECLEEIGQKVTIQEIAHIREYIGKNHQYAEFDYDLHQVEYYFSCQLTSSLEECRPQNPDEHQVDVVWVNLNELHQLRFYPYQMIKYLIHNEGKKIYLGDTN